jgi:hypothetical protein
MIKQASETPLPYRVQWTAYQIPTAMQAGKEYTVRVTVRNDGAATWGSEPSTQDAIAPVYLSYHWLHPTGMGFAVYDGLRTPLPHDVAPGEACSVSEVRVAAPPTGGAYRLQITLVH